MEVNLAALLRDEAFTVKACIVKYIPKPAIETAPADPIPVPAPPTVGNMPARRVNLAPAAPASSLTDGEEFTFICLDKSIRTGDFALVATKYGICLAVIVSVDDELCIEPGDTIRYEYVVSKVDLTDYVKTLQRDAEIQKVYRDSYRATARQSFKNQMLLGITDDAAKQRLQSLLK